MRLFILIGSQRPARKYLKDVRSLFAKNWYDVGLELLEPEDENKLDEIQTNKGGNVSECCTDMLHLWLQKQPYATWNQLIDALKSPGVEMFDVASKIEGMLKGKDTLSTTRSKMNRESLFSYYKNSHIKFKI